MTTPRATYRLQFREHLDFAKAAALMPYLARLGVSHAYASPLQAARKGSTHGYDGIDFGRMEPAIGGDDGFRPFAEAMRKAGLRLLLDIVPNHMGVTPDNGWWRDVLTWGRRSAYAQHFDIDWSAPKLLLPILGATYAEALEKGELVLGFDGGTGAFALSYYDTQLPLTPPSLALILAGCGDEGLVALGRRLAVSSPDSAAELQTTLTEAAFARAIRDRVTETGNDKAQLHALIEAQPWQLLHWRNARERLTYRRFFEIADLVGVRVEAPHVFADVHRLVLELVRSGIIDGLRIDHIDGLADPRDYLQRLQAAVGQEGFYVVVEKILGHGEVLRPDWPIAGSTGYEFIAALASVMTDDAKAAELDAAYAGFVGQPVAYADMARDIKRRMLTHNLASELDVLTKALSGLAAAQVATRDMGPDTLRAAIVELAVAMVVYRTYIDARGAAPEDRALLDAAAERAKASRLVEDPAAIDWLVKVLCLGVPPQQQADALRFVFRFQQTTGPLMAKAIEDTLFYRYNRLIALNEVGGEPDTAGTGVAGFHEAMAHRQETQAGGLSTTATHDTKRGEDARARLYALSEMPEAWAMAVQRWSQMNRSHAKICHGTRWPEPATEWFFYQSLLGAWPLDRDVPGAGELRSLRDRLQGLMQKAVREAKVHSTWTAPAEDYEGALKHFVDGVLDPALSRRFLEDFAEVAKPMLLAGVMNSMTQLLVKLAAPGVPDIYQGTELWDLALVDPDNRRAVDFAARADLARVVMEHRPRDLVTDWRSGALKMRLMMAGLALRRDLDGWETAAYLPAYAQGAKAHHVLGFARDLGHARVLAVGVRLPLTLLGAATEPVVPVAQWGDTHLVPPQEVAGMPLIDAVTGETMVLPREGLPVADILRQFPVALLATAR